MVQTQHPEALGRPSRALAQALHLAASPEVSWHESLESIVRRPAGGEPDAATRQAQNMLILIGTTGQLTTAAAHADEYASYPVSLLKSVSYDLRRSMTGMISLLRALESPRRTDRAIE